MVSEPGSSCQGVRNQWYRFGVGAPPILVYFSGDWDVHQGYDLAFDPWPYPRASGSLSFDPQIMVVAGKHVAYFFLLWFSG